MKKVILLLSVILCGFIAKSQTVPITDTVKVTLIGTDTDGTIVSYSFKQTSGTTATVLGGSTASPILVFSTSGTYVFNGSVTDNDGGTYSATFTVQVNSANVLPRVKIMVNGVEYTNSTFQIKLK